MLQMIGRSAHSAFRLDKLVTSVQAQVESVLAIRSEYRYFIEVEGEGSLSNDEQAVVETLLEAKIRNSVAADSEQFFLVTPRPGTISPWSSKATDIAHNSGVNNILRIERGIAFFVKTNGSLSREQRAVIVPHDEYVTEKPHYPKQQHSFYQQRLIQQGFEQRYWIQW